MKDEWLKHILVAARRVNDIVDRNTRIHKPALLRRVRKNWRNNNRIEHRVLFTGRKRSYIVNHHWCRCRGSCMALVVWINGEEISMPCLRYGKYFITHTHARMHTYNILVTLKRTCSNVTLEDVTVLGECW